MCAFALISHISKSKKIANLCAQNRRKHKIWRGVFWRYDNKRFKKLNQHVTHGNEIEDFRDNLFKYNIQFLQRRNSKKKTMENHWYMKVDGHVKITCH